MRCYGNPEKLMVNICPKPFRWHEIYERLRKGCSERDTSPPPTPLILNGWVYSNDVEKADRWAKTVEWAKQNGLVDLIQLEPQDWYVVEQPSTYQLGPLGGPTHLPWHFEPAEKPSDEAAEAALARLLENWPRIAGEVARHTKPTRITGEKLRRLVVAVALSAPPPPWGDWDRLAEDESRRAFTELRRAVNSTVAPLEIDHIEFEVGSVPRAEESEH